MSKFNERSTRPFLLALALIAGSVVLDLLPGPRAMSITVLIAVAMFAGIAILFILAWLWVLAYLEEDA